MELRAQGAEGADGIVSNFKIKKRLRLLLITNQLITSNYQ